MGNNIILIGMPGCGKSTVGVVLAKTLGYRFVDSDLLIQEKTGKLLYQIIEDEGLDGFNKIEEDVNASINLTSAVIATGGSAVYGQRAMEHLKEIGTVVYLRSSLETLEERLGDLNERGVSIKEGMTLKDLFDERRPLYEKYADITVDTSKTPIRNVVKSIKEMTAEITN